MGTEEERKFMHLYHIEEPNCKFCANYYCTIFIVYDSLYFAVHPMKYLESGMNRIIPVTSQSNLSELCWREVPDRDS